MIQDVALQFRRDVDEISRKLISAFELSFEELGPPGLNDPLLRWMDFRLRYIEQKPRSVIASKRFPLKLPVEIEAALSSMEQRIINGDDLNPYQSKTSRSNDTSGPKRQRRTDGLWADWGIHHLHLSAATLSIDQKFSDRSNWLLFLMVFEDAVAFIDVRSHDEVALWSQLDLVKTYIDSWPEHADRFRMRGVLGSSNPRRVTSQEHAQLRAAGISSAILHNGAVYNSPGQGVTSATTSEKVTFAMRRIFSNLKSLAVWAQDETGWLRAEMKKLGIESPVLTLILSPAGLGIADQSRSDVVWTFPRTESTQHRNAMVELHNDFLPPWALGPLVAYWAGAA